MENRLASVVLAAFIVLSAAGLIVAVQAAEQRHRVPVGDSPALGPSNAPVTLIEFIDYQ